MKDHRFVWDFRGRRSIRIPGYDYSQPGWYMVTICTQDRECLFGEVCNDSMILNDAGLAMLTWWTKIGETFGNTLIDMFVVMPNHFHGILTLTAPDERAPVGADPCVRPDMTQCACPDLIAEDLLDVHPHREEVIRFISDPSNNVRGGHMGPPLRKPSLFENMKWFKTMSTNSYITGVKRMDWPRFNKHLWQRNYWEHVIRSEFDLEEARQYIINNPANWAKDEMNPASSTRLSTA